MQRAASKIGEVFLRARLKSAILSIPKYAIGRLRWLCISTTPHTFSAEAGHRFEPLPGAALRATLSSSPSRLTRRSEMIMQTALPVAAIGYSLIYLLFGGGIGGAFVIFIIAKLLGK